MTARHRRRRPVHRRPTEAEVCLVLGSFIAAAGCMCTVLTGEPRHNGDRWDFVVCHNNPDCPAASVEMSIADALAWLGRHLPADMDLPEQWA